MAKTCLWTLLKSCFILLVIAGCRKSLEPAAWDVDVLAPIAKGGLTVRDAIKPPFEAFSDSSGAMVLRFEEELISIGIDSLFDIPDTAIQQVAKVNPLPVAIPFATAHTVEEDLKFNLKEVQLTEAIVRESNISVKLYNPLSYAVLVSYSIPSATLDGDTFVISALVGAKTTFNKEFNLRGYTLDLRGKDHNSFNKLATRVKIEKDPALTVSVSIPGNTEFTVTTELERIVPEFAKGYFGSQVFDFDASDTLDLFGSVPAGTFQFGAYNLELEITNGVGIDLKMLVNSLSSTNTQSGATASLTGSMAGQSIFLNRAIRVGSEETPVIQTHKQVVFTESNSNLSDLVGIRPDLFSYDLGLNINPLGNISLGNDFVYYGHDLDIKLKAEVPLQVGFNGLVLLDTVSLNFDRSKNEQVELLNSGEIKVYVQNMFPIGLSLQGYLLDPAGMVTDSLFTSAQTIEAAIPGATGKVETAMESTVIAPLSQHKMDHLDLADRVILKARLHTDPAISPVVVYDDYEINVSIVADLNVRTRK